MAPALSATRNNCHISDAQHATDFSLCVYLLKMREYFRWENRLPFSATLPHNELTAWLTERERLWETVGEQPFESIPVGKREYDPFDADTINDQINHQGYVYSSGIGRNLKPHFFIGSLEEIRRHNGYTLYLSGREYARDLVAPPAMSLGTRIFIRRESLRRMLWEKLEEWRWNKPANAMQKAIACYDFDSSPEEALNRMVDNEIHSVMLHEIGEVMAGETLGSDWENLLADLSQSKAELMVRAVRDHLADSLSTLPGLLEDGDPASLHFYIANLGNLRKSLCPTLITAYESWERTGDIRKLDTVARKGREHWLSVASDILALYREAPADLQKRITSRVEGAAL
ncbi:MAG: hypothetical protein JSU75_00030 [Gammaproteobacteria bacterium]|nr:MAG: hypothetical protein JSU75_00030 [Gammaproteobacteria bacterium]